jgi:hypothetical protein
VTAAHPGTAGTTAAGDRDPFLDPACQLVVAWTSPIICDFDGALRQASASLEEFRGEDERFATALAAFTTSSLEKTVVCYDTRKLPPRSTSRTGPAGIATGPPARSDVQVRTGPSPTLARNADYALWRAACSRGQLRLAHRSSSSAGIWGGRSDRQNDVLIGRCSCWFRVIGGRPGWVEECCSWTGGVGRRPRSTTNSNAAATVVPPPTGADPLCQQRKQLQQAPTIVPYQSDSKPTESTPTATCAAICRRQCGPDQGNDTWVRFTP